MQDFKNLDHLPGYAIHSDGYIFSLKTNKKLKPFTSNSGYEVVSLSINGIVAKYSVHRLVALAFCPNPNKANWVNHKNGIKTDNHGSNLEWVTPSENNQYSYDIGLNKPKRGEKHFAAKLSDKQVEEIRILLSEGKFYKEIAKLYRVTTSTIGAIKRGERRAS